MEEVATLRSVTVETGSGFLSGAWAPFVWAWDRQGNPAFVPHLLGPSGYDALTCGMVNLKSPFGKCTGYIAKAKSEAGIFSMIVG